VLEKMKLPMLFGSVAGWAGTLAGACLANACAVCVTGGANDPSADGYNWSVLFLMATPYVVAGSVAGWLVYAYRRAAAKGEQSDAAEPDGHLAWNQKESRR
jgi:hypothetical protein